MRQALVMASMMISIGCALPLRREQDRPTAEDKLVISPVGIEKHVGEKISFAAELVKKDTLLVVYNWRPTNHEVLRVNLFTGEAEGLKPGESGICASVLYFYKVRRDGVRESIRYGSLNSRGQLNETCSDGKKPIVILP